MAKPVDEIVSLVLVENFVELFCYPPAQRQVKLTTFQEHFKVGQIGSKVLRGLFQGREVALCGSCIPEQAREKAILAQLDFHKKKQSRVVLPSLLSRSMEDTARPYLGCPAYC